MKLYIMKYSSFLLALSLFLFTFCQQQSESGEPTVSPFVNNAIN